MGLSDAGFWLGHFFTGFIFMFAESIIIIIILKTVKTATEVAVLPNTDFTLLLVAFALFGWLHGLLVVLLSCLVGSGRKDMMPAA